MPGGSPNVLCSSNHWPVPHSRERFQWSHNATIYTWLFGPCSQGWTHLPISHILQVSLLTLRQPNNAYIRWSSLSWWCPCYESGGSWLPLCCEHERARYHSIWLCDQQVHVLCALNIGAHPNPIDLCVLCVTRGAGLYLDFSFSTSPLVLGLGAIMEEFNL